MCEVVDGVVTAWDKEAFFSSFCITIIIASFPFQCYFFSLNHFFWSTKILRLACLLRAQITRNHWLVQPHEHLASPHHNTFRHPQCVMWGRHWARLPAETKFRVPPERVSISNSPYLGPERNTAWWGCRCHWQVGIDPFRVGDSHVVGAGICALQWRVTALRRQRLSTKAELVG